jgi:hypothetical protein
MAHWRSADDGVEYEIEGNFLLRMQSKQGWQLVDSLQEFTPIEQ